MLTLFPHPESAQWWLSGQANIIFPGPPALPLPLPGRQQLPQLGRIQDLRWSAPFYAAWRPTHSVRYNTDLIFDLE